ncbi:Sulfatase modifying factor 1 precursor (C-alpha-formyglycine-generating enzyme 1) [Gulosibacter sp. 10]|nr:Sulfatase modifying factor 1 precursor (C-alpha-formyglycine-generating enzyme 1) [Gulosibacter sp. 10]
MTQPPPDASCCAPRRARPTGGAAPEAAGESPAPRVRPVEAVPPDAESRSAHAIEQCLVPGGRFRIGDASGDGLPADGETPVHPVELDEFEIDATPVTNSQFSRFVDATGYATEAERLGASAVFHLLVDAPTGDIGGPVPRTPWWITVRGADWRRPEGRASSLAGRASHPVVHVTWNDALAYCAWAGRSLPTEAQWEVASRGGLVGATFPWGEEPIDGDDGVWRANVWQGTFPAHNTAADGWIGTAPVRSYAPNGYGLWQTVGNVWEWCADWFAADAYESAPLHDPAGPAQGSERVLRGGSYLCHPSYCNRYRNSARSRNTPDSSMGNAGFRTVSQG